MRFSTMRFSTSSRVLFHMLELEGMLMTGNALHRHYAEFECIDDVHSLIELAGRKLGAYEEARMQGDAVDCSPLAQEVQSNLQVIAAGIYEYLWTKSIEDGRFDYRFEKAVATCNDPDLLMTI